MVQESQCANCRTEAAGSKLALFTKMNERRGHGSPRRRAVQASAGRKDPFQIGILANRLEQPFPNPVITPARKPHIGHMPPATNSSGKSRQGAAGRSSHSTASMNSRLSEAIMPLSPRLPSKRSLIRSHWSLRRILCAIVPTLSAGWSDSVNLNLNKP